jgi:hypothetical protein
MGTYGIHTRYGSSAAGESSPSSSSSSSSSCLRVLVEDCVVRLWPGGAWPVAAISMTALVTYMWSLGAARGSSDGWTRGMQPPPEKFGGIGFPAFPAFPSPNPAPRARLAHIYDMS